MRELPLPWKLPIFVVAVVAGLLVWHWADSADAYFNRWASAELTQRIYNADFRLAQSCP